MHVLFLNPIGDLGGAERIILDLMRSLAEMPDVRQSLIAAADGPFVAAAKGVGVETHVVPMPAAIAGVGESGLGGGVVGKLKLGARVAIGLPALVRYRRAMREAVERIGPDIVHSNGLKMHVLSRGIAGGRPLVWQIQDFFASRAISGRLLRRLRGPDVAIAISAAVAKDVAPLLPRARVETVLAGIDLDEFSPAGETLDLDAAGGLPPSDQPDVVRIGMVAAYARWKGHDVFLRAAAEAVRDNAEVARRARFYIIGGPIYRTGGSQFSVDELRTLADSLGLSGRIGFVPFQNNPVAAQRALDVMVHASTRPEPFGRTIVESMACGKAVVVADAGGAAELFTQGVDAVGTPPGDVGLLAGAMVQLVTRDELRLKISTEAYANRGRFDRRRMGDGVAEIYRTLLHLAP